MEPIPHGGIRRCTTPQVQKIRSEQLPTANGSWALHFSDCLNKIRFANIRLLSNIYRIVPSFFLHVGRLLQQCRNLTRSAAHLNLILLLIADDADLLNNFTDFSKSSTSIVLMFLVLLFPSASSTQSVQSVKKKNPPACRRVQIM